VTRTTGFIRPPSFRYLWPIFRAVDLPEDARRSRPQHRGRQRVVDYYQLRCPDVQRSPDCHLTHDDRIPLDWPHTLEALYRVRCNLFHGQKSGGGNEDREILTAALQVLLPIATSVVDGRAPRIAPSVSPQI